MTDRQAAMTKREALARYLHELLDGVSSREWQDMPQPYVELSDGNRARAERPRWRGKVYPEMPMWDWKHGETARDILTFLGIDPEAAHE